MTHPITALRPRPGEATACVIAQGAPAAWKHLVTFRRWDGEGKYTASPRSFVYLPVVWGLFALPWLPTTPAALRAEEEGRAQALLRGSLSDSRDPKRRGGQGRGSSSVAQVGVKRGEG